jgi:hypothetical protein
MRHTRILSAALAVLALTLTGCAAASPSPYDSSGRDASGQALIPAESLADDMAEQSMSSLDRQVVTTGWVTITVDQPLDAATDAVRIAEAAGGRVDGRTEYAPVDGDQGSASLTLRLPAATLTATLEGLKKLGTVQEVSLNSADVTMESQDLDARISALSTSVDRLLALLATATDTDSLIQLETALSDRQGQLESLVSQRRYLSDQIALSTVTLNLQSVDTTPAPDPGSFFDGLTIGWNSLVALFAGLVVVAGVVLPWLILPGAIAVIVAVVVRHNRARRPDGH